MGRLRAHLPLTADRVTDALSDSEKDLVAAIGEAASMQRRGDAGLLITGSPIPTLNGVLTLRPSAASADVRDLLDVAKSANVPYSLLLRAGSAKELIELARSRGMTEDESIPLMAMARDVDRARAAAQHPELEIRRLDVEETELHASIAAEGFEAPVEVFRHLISPALMLRPGHKAYVGTVAGENVTTVLSVARGDSVGIFNVATPPRHRGRGYGKAITARAVLDGFEAGAEYAYLQSSPMGYRVYQALGFRTLETWSVWVSGSPSHS